MIEKEWWYNEEIIAPLIEITPTEFEYDMNFKGYFLGSVTILAGDLFT